MPEQPTPVKSSRRWLRRSGITALVLLVATVLFGAVGVPLYVFPATDEPRKVDVVYVIGPPSDSRMDVARTMLEEGLADTLMVSLDRTQTHWRVAQDACVGAWDFDVVCHRPEPFTTRGEAQWLRDEVQEHGWTSAAVITFTPHITRTRVLFDRCFAGDLVMIETDTERPLDEWAYQYAYQTAALTKVVARPSC